MITSKALMLTVVAHCCCCCQIFLLTDAFAPPSTPTSFGVVARRRLSATRVPNTLSTAARAAAALPRRLSRRWLALDDDDDDNLEDYDEEEPLSAGVDSVSWLPPVQGALSSSGDESSEKEDADVIPLFPLGGIVYTPNSEHILNIFEPRYRQMYNDILMNGTKRFAVSMSHPTEEGRFAVWGVLFELEDLKEVSEQTGDKIKYICNHKVTGRVKLHRILNPDAWQSRETYLRAEGTIIDDSGPVSEDEECPKEQKALREAFAQLVELQHELEEDVRFTRASVISLSIKPGSGEDGLWQTIKLWQSFADQRLMARQNELQKDFQEKLQAFLKKERGLKGEELPSAIKFQDLSAELQNEVMELQKRMAVELQPLVLESTLTMQKILECPDHRSRLELVQSFVEAESKRLTTKKTITGVFSSKSDARIDESLIPPEEQISEAEDSAARKKSERSRPFFSDDDAFQ